MANLAPLPQLEELWVQGIDLTPAGAESLLNLGALKRLTMNREAMTPDLRAKFFARDVKVRSW